MIVYRKSKKCIEAFLTPPTKPCVLVKKIDVEIP